MHPEAKMSCGTPYMLIGTQVRVGHEVWTADGRLVARRLLVYTSCESFVEELIQGRQLSEPGTYIFLRESCTGHASCVRTFKLEKMPTPPVRMAAS